MPSSTKSSLANLVDTSALQSLMDDFYDLAGIPMSLIDIEGRLLVGVGWQDVCTGFHRVHPESCRACVESDTELSAGIPPGEFRLYKCKNHMWDVATPVFVGDRHVGNVFSGQFFFDDEPIDYQVFRDQARQYGFDEAAYIAALDRVPRLSRERLTKGLAFFVKLAHMVSRLADSNVTLARTLTERDALNLRLAEADRRKDEFIAILSHELRNPLAPIRYALPLIEREGLGGSASHAVAVIDRQVAHLTRLVDDLLDVGRITSGKIELRQDRATIESVVRVAVEAASPAIANAHHTLEVAIPDPAVPLHVDVARLAQVVTNLLDNSAKYTPRGGHITLEAVRDGAQALIRVRDDGIGIPLEELPTVFEMFRQVNHPGRTQGGLGIGLALAKRLIEMHGGTIEAHSEGVNRGAEFIVRLPVADVADAMPELDSAGEPHAAAARLKVLVVDDNDDALAMLAFVVQSLGYEVHTADDGKSAIAAARSCRPHVMLLDLGLPGLSGLDVARELRRDPAMTGLTLVAVTGWGQEEDRQDTSEAGFDHHLTKPADPKHLESLLRELARMKT